jgi:hypothetical protein
MPIEHDTVDVTEQLIERSQASKPSKFQKLPDMKPITKAVIQNFTCPECGDILPETVAYNGYIQGECGRSHTRIRVKV